MLIIAILILLLAATSSVKHNYKYLAEYIKLNRIVFIIFILGAYIAYNTLDINAIGSGIGIYGGVFKVTILSQVFDILLFIIGAIVTILVCFIPYNFSYFSDIKLSSFFFKKNIINSLDLFEEHSFFKYNLREYNYKDYYIYYNSNNNNINNPNAIKGFINTIKKLSELFPKINIKTPFITEKDLIYNKLEVKEYSLLLLFTVFGGSLLISSQNLISLYLSLELQSFTLYILSTSQIKSFKGTSGGLKYFLLGGLSSGFILLGCSLLYAYTGTLSLEHIYMIYSNNVSNYFIDPCLLILFAGLLFKISAAPFHNWAPDVYSDVPTYSTTWLIVIAKFSILILMLLLIHNIHSGFNLSNISILDQYYSLNVNSSNSSDLNKIELGVNNIDNMSILYLNKSIPFSFWNPSYSSLGLWTNILILSAIFSLLIGTILGVSQSRIKRLFAYSTISHVGFLLLALSINSITSLDAFIFYLIQYTITNLNLFFIIIAWGYLYSRYYLEKNFISLRNLNINSYSWKDFYIEPTLHDFFNSFRFKYDKQANNNYIFHSNKNIKINTVYNYFVTHNNLHDYDFNIEKNEWLYTPVPFLTNLKGMHKTDPFLAFCLSVTIFSLAGIPPLIGFFAKQQILLASMQLDYYFISVIAIFTSVIAAAYYLRIIKFIYFYDDVFMPYYLNNADLNNNLSNFTKNPKFTLDSINQNNLLFILPSNNLSLIIAILTNLSLFYVLKPYILINAIYYITIPLFQI